MAGEVGQINENFDLLTTEKQLVRNALRDIHNLGFLTDKNRKKNAIDAVQYRKKGNELYKSHSAKNNSQKHLEILNLYSTSMALAPTDSEELALAYGNRSALLFHLKKYEECIKDCDKALDVTVSNDLEVKLLCRKSECLAALNDKMTKLVCDETLEILDQLTLDETLKSKYINKVNNIKNFYLSQKPKNSKITTEKQAMLPKFIRQKEVPCASEAVKINYSKEWGRHVVAMQQIEAGDIIAVEKNYYRFTLIEGMYFHCANCSQYVWSSIPCKYCICGVYCSEECRYLAWEKFHQFECELYSLIWDIGKRNGPLHHLRFLFNAIHEVGGIEELKKEYMEIEKNTDCRTKGFSADGVFYSDRCRSLLNLPISVDTVDFVKRVVNAAHIAKILFLLANKTTFFGQILNCSAIDLLKFQNVIFVGALLLKMSFNFNRNTILHQTYNNNYQMNYGIIANPFCNLFNHSCDPNVHFIYSNNNEIIVYARKPIKKGEQLFRSYYGDFSHQPKNQRQSLLLENYYFQCNCQACKEDWSISLPSLTDMIGLERSTNLLIQNVSKVLYNDLICNVKEIRYGLEKLKELKHILRILASKASIHCKEYLYFETILLKVYFTAYGYCITIPDKC